jgi:tetratricopeptide (TPR) repeat protein
LLNDNHNEATNMTSETQLERYLGFLESDPNNIQLIANTANLAYESDQFQQALTLADTGLSIEPNHQILLSTKALSHMSLGDTDKALAIFQQLLSLGEQHPVIRYNMAYCYALQQQHDQALPLLEDSLQHYADMPQMLHLHMRVLHELEALEDAIALGLQALSLHHDADAPIDDAANGKVHELLSSLYVDMADFSAAQHHAALALKTNPNLPNAHTSIGTAALSTQDDQIALQHFNQAITLNQQDGRAWLGKAMALMLQNKLTEAEASFNAAITHMPTHLGSYQALAWCQITQNNLTAAQQTAQKALAIDDTFSENHGTLAVLAVMQGNIELAQREAQVALRLDKASFSGNYAQALVLQAKGDDKGGQQMIDSLLDSPEVINQQSLRQFVLQHQQKLQSQKLH